MDGCLQQKFITFADPDSTPLGLCPHVVHVLQAGARRECMVSNGYKTLRKLDIHQRTAEAEGIVSDTRYSLRKYHFLYLLPGESTIEDSYHTLSIGIRRRDQYVFNFTFTDPVDVAGAVAVGGELQAFAVPGLFVTTALTYAILAVVMSEGGGISSPSGGPAVTVVLAAACATALFLPTKKTESAPVRKGK